MELKGEECVLKDLVIATGWLRKLQKSVMYMQLLSWFIIKPFHILIKFQYDFAAYSVCIYSLYLVFIAHIISPKVSI